MRSVGVITGACAVGCTCAGQSCGSRTAARVRCIFPPTRAYTHLMVSVTTSRVERSYTHIVSTLHPGRGVIRLGVEGDGRSLVGRLHPPLKGGWPLHTPPTNQHPQSFGQTPEWIRSNKSDPCEGAGVDDGRGRHQGVSTKMS